MTLDVDQLVEKLTSRANAHGWRLVESENLHSVCQGILDIVEEHDVASKAPDWFDYAETVKYRIIKHGIVRWQSSVTEDAAKSRVNALAAALAFEKSNPENAIVSEHQRWRWYPDGSEWTSPWVSIDTDLPPAPHDVIMGVLTRIRAEAGLPDDASLDDVIAKVERHARAETALRPIGALRSQFLAALLPYVKDLVPEADDFVLVAHADQMIDDLADSVQMIMLDDEGLTREVIETLTGDTHERPDVSAFVRGTIVALKEIAMRTPGDLYDS